MARRDVVPFILEALDPWLNKIQAAYDEQPEAARSTTLPVLPEGKVNVVGIVRALGLPPADQKYFHTKPEIRDLVNSFAEAQGVKGIGSRAALDQVDQSVSAKFQMLSGLKRSSDMELVEALRRNEDLIAENEMLKKRCDRFQAALREIYQRGDLPGPTLETVLRAD